MALSARAHACTHAQANTGAHANCNNNNSEFERSRTRAQARSRLQVFTQTCVCLVWLIITQMQGNQTHSSLAIFISTCSPPQARARAPQSESRQ